MKKSLRPTTKVKNLEPNNIGSPDWVVWAAWATESLSRKLRKKAVIQRVMLSS